MLELIAELRRSRRLPELLRSQPRARRARRRVAPWAEFDDDRRRDVLAAVDVADRVEPC